MDLTNARGRLTEQFAGVFSPETVAECLRDSALRLQAGARIDAHVPVLAERFARERLRAGAQVEGA